jgi:hypothetical protein
LSSKIILDRYVYEDIYPAFKAATDEKKITANINRTFLNCLGQRNLVFPANTPAAVADIGCGPCDTLIQYLTGVPVPQGFIVRATDYLPQYADGERGEAHQILAAAQARNELKLVSFSVQAGEAFAGKLLELLSEPQDGAKIRNAFHLVFASHVVYHAEAPGDVQRMLADVANNVLTRDGICIMYHIGYAPASFQEFRARFGSEARSRAASNTGAVTIDDPPAQISAACAAQRLPIYEMEFTTNLRFGSLRDEEWLIFKDPGRYDVLAESNPAAYEDLKRLYFIVQRAPLEFAADHSATGLNAFVDETRKVIEANHGALPSYERLQVATRADAAPILAEAIPEALAASAPSGAGKASG